MHKAYRPVGNSVVTMSPFQLHGNCAVLEYVGVIVMIIYRINDHGTYLDIG